MDGPFPPELGTVIAFVILPFAMMFYRWCGEKIRNRTSRMTSSRLRKILLFEIYADED